MSDPEKTSEEQANKSRVAKIVPYQFKPGQSGNPAGRPKGTTLSLTTRLKQELKKKAINYKTGEPILLDGKECTFEDLLIARSIHKGIISGDKDIHKMIYERIEGKPSQSIKFKDESEGKEKAFDKIDKIHSILTGKDEHSTDQGEDSSETTV